MSTEQSATNSLPPPAIPLAQGIPQMPMQQPPMLQPPMQQPPMLQLHQGPASIPHQGLMPPQVIPQLPQQYQQAVPQYQELNTIPTTTPTPTCSPCRNRGMMMLLAIVLLAAIIYLIFYGDELFKKE